MGDRRKSRGGWHRDDGEGRGRKTQGYVPDALRKGKWNPEEEAYANKIIHLFNKGLLPIPTGTTLRSYLSEKLNW